MSGELPDDLVPVNQPGEGGAGGGALPDDLVPVAKTGYSVKTEDGRVIDYQPNEKGELVPSAPRFAAPDISIKDGRVNYNGQPLEGPAAEEIATRSRIADTAKAWSLGPRSEEIIQSGLEGWRIGWGDQPLGSWMMKDPRMQNDYSTAAGRVFAAWNEGFNRPIAQSIDYLFRWPQAAYRSAQGFLAPVVGRDVVSIPDAFAGSPGALGRGRLPIEQEAGVRGPALTINPQVARDLNVIGPERVPIAELKPAQAADMLVQPITAYHGSPYSFEAFSLGKVGTGEGAASYGHGIYLAENIEVANSYKRVTPAAGVSEAEALARNAFTATGGDRASAIEQLKALGDVAKKDGRDPAAQMNAADWLSKNNIEQNVYEVRVHANTDHLLDWDAPLTEQSKWVQEKLEKFGVDPANGQTGEEIIRGLQASARKGKLDPSIWAADADAHVSQVLKEAGIPGLKYLDEGSRDAGAGTRNMVIFDESRIEIVARNGEPIRPAIEEPAPRAQAATSTADAVKRSETEAEWRARFEQSVSKLQTHEEAKEILRMAANEGDNFPAARRGEIPLAHLDALATAAGLDPTTLDARGIGRLLKNDNEVRYTVEATIKLSEDVHSAMIAVRNGPDDLANLAKLQEAVMRHNIAVEQYLGLRAEWGRTGNVFQEFMEASKDAITLNNFLKKRKGTSLDDLRRLAEAGSRLNDPTAVARLLNDARKPGYWDKFTYYWVNSLLSGFGSYGAYSIADATFTLYEAAVVTPTAGMVGAVRSVFSDGKAERVYMGETGARIVGLAQGIPDAIVAAYEALKSGNVTLLPHEIVDNYNKNPVMPAKPIEGKLGAIIGIPSRLLGVEHTFFKFLNYRSEIEAQAYRQAVKDGYSPLSGDFWNVKRDHAAFPKEEWMDRGIEHGAYMTYTQELGAAGRTFQTAMNRSKLGKLVVPFFRTPANVLKIAQEGTALAFLDEGMRGRLTGKEGQIAQDTQIARLVAGSTIMGLFVYWASADMITDNGPPPGPDRDAWLLTHKPNSVRIGNEWYNYQKFGPVAGHLSAAATLAAVGTKLNDKEYAEAAAQAAFGMMNTVNNTAGFQGVSQLVQAVQDPNRYGSRYITNFTTGFLPASTFLGQAAATGDPLARDPKGFMDALKYRTPGLRSTLFPLRDWKGVPIANNREELGIVIAHSKVNTDPIDLEMSSLGIHPAKIEDRIRGVKLTQGQYDRLQSLAGALTVQTLNEMMATKGWHDQPMYARQTMMRSAIASTREIARATLQMEYPELLQNQIEDKVRQINGEKPLHRKNP